VPGVARTYAGGAPMHRGAPRTRAILPLPRPIRGLFWLLNGRRHKMRCQRHPRKESCLGEKAKETGVYVIHHAGLIKYVGKTNAPTMSFGMRLRREFQESASGGKHPYPRLAALAVPPEIMVTLFPGSDLKRLVRPSGMTLGSLEAIEIFETALIQVYDPEFQHHHVNRTATYIKKRGFTREQLAAVINRSSGIAK
jgi:hypothetical protein